MKLLFFFITLFPLLLFAQSKKKKALAEQQANVALIANLKEHLQFLADDKLEGRRTGTYGEELAMNYIINQYKKTNIEPKGDDGYIQPFIINEGKKITNNTQLLINNQPAFLDKHFFPLAYSANKVVQSKVAMSLNEAGNIWFKDVKDWLEDNQNNPHYDINDALKKYTEKITTKGAIALIVFNSGTTEDNIQFNKSDTTFTANIPVLYLTKEGATTFFHDNTAMQEISISVDIQQKVRIGHNVVAFINNNAPTTVILGAHYDHLGYGEDGNALDTGHIIHNGADDNASGTAALIELAKKLIVTNSKNNNYLFIHFSGEELGLLGSKYWVQHNTATILPNYMINLDMVGRYDTAHKLTIGGYGTSPIWGDVFKTVSAKNLLIKLDSSGTGPSDHSSFYRANIPVLFFFTGTHPDYHNASDDCSKINYEGERQIVEYIYRLINTADTKQKLPFTKTTEAITNSFSSFTVTLGVLPDYSFSGNGVRIDGVSAGKQAERIGLQAGDVLLQLGDYKFIDLANYMKALSKFKLGDTTRLTVLRQGEEKIFDIHF